jgi:hypothetical protein
MQNIDYSGYECASLDNGTLRLLVTRSVGPRIISFGFTDGINLLAQVPDLHVDLPDGGIFHFRGGHRLWHAPEELSTTYIPDNDPVEINSQGNGLLVTQKMQAKTGLQKSLEIIPISESQITITHRIANRGANAVTCAPWAITQFKTGGVAILPQAKHDMGMLPNRSLAFWSYSDMSNPNVTWGKEYILVSAQMESPFKIGFPNPRGWLAYWLEGTLFIKRADYYERSDYYDFGSSSECYCNDRFLELETLAPISKIPPGETATHIEMWELYKDIERPRDENGAQALVEHLKLDTSR